MSSYKIADYDLIIKKKLSELASVLKDVDESIQKHENHNETTHPFELLITSKGEKVITVQNIYAIYDALNAIRKRTGREINLIDDIS